MWMQSFIASLLLTLAFVLYMADAVSFLAPYRRTLLTGYWAPACAFLAMWVLTVAVAIYLTVRVVTLGRVGRRLRHVSRDHDPFEMDDQTSSGENFHA